MNAEKSTYHVMCENFDKRIILHEFINTRFNGSECEQEIFVIEDGVPGVGDTLWKSTPDGGDPQEVPAIDNDDEMSEWLNGTGLSKKQLLKLVSAYDIWG